MPVDPNGELATTGGQWSLLLSVTFKVAACSYSDVVNGVLHVAGNCLEYPCNMLHQQHLLSCSGGLVIDHSAKCIT